MTSERTPRDHPHHEWEGPRTEKTLNEVRSLAEVDFRTNERDMPKHKLRTKTTTKGKLVTAKVTPEQMARYFERAGRDPNASLRSSPVILNHRLCK